MAKTPDFTSFVALLAGAEAKLVAGGQGAPLERSRTLRGLYYGTTWSLDYEVESKRSVTGARIRNAGFITYTGGGVPADPRPLFARTNTVQDLKDSQSLKEPGRSVDVGHVLIGLETRGTFARTHVFPEGGTGLEVVTWLGDLGGGTANLARRRAKAPSTSVEYVFHNATSDYGVSDNLEGDIAAYVVAAGATPGGPPVYGNGGVADAFKAYLLPATSKPWRDRSASFAGAIGATVGTAGITNKPALVSTLAKKLSDFGYWYAATRWVPTGELTGDLALKTCQHMDGAAREVATVFVDTLQTAIVNAPAAVEARGPYPKPSGLGSCGSTLLMAAAAAGGTSPFGLPEIPHLW
ncbi:MAG: hypothetical protein JHC95_15075 [Solirubrobacteraceae bacterium]|nr:hypothetical protein [Solirubrobacteraceae bacterium]